MSKKLFFIIFALFTSGVIFSQESETEKPKKIEYEAYGVVNYYNYDWQTDKQKKDAFDVERLNLYLKYNLTPKIQIKTEFEFEHGGTGTTMELDKFEEFGEFESEIEKGGEVKIEQLNILFKVKPWLNFRVGRVKLYMGNASKLDLPIDYFTGYRSQMENTLTPVGWYENGIELLGDIGSKQQFSYKLYFVNGLTSDEFSSANWIKRGHQGKFELMNAENMAFAGRFDYNLKNHGFVGVSAYLGNSNSNRQQTLLDNVQGYVSVLDAHANINLKAIKIRAMFLYGNLQNSDIISDANNNLPNLLNAKRTPVAKNAMGYYAEIAYDIMSIFYRQKSTEQQLYVFGRYDFYDSMYKTMTGYFDNPRWERKEITFGVNYLIVPEVVFKAHYSMRTLGIGVDNKENTFLVGVAFALE